MPAILVDHDGTLVDSARLARALGVGLLFGGYGADELQSARAYRVYENLAELPAHLDEVGVRSG
jgi:phosphoglycolate phosphatase-like HAD superfamily hydrolase